MKVYIDENIPYGKEFFKDFGDIYTFSGRSVSAEQLIDADVLLVRSITKVDKKLLENNHRIKFVGTATIGTDHIDLDYLQQRNIYFSSAPGCNKISVAEYVLSALCALSETKNIELKEKKVSIVGAGNIGTAVYNCLTALGIQCLLYDPPLQAAGDKRAFCEFSDVLNADIISLHVPKITSGPFKTIHLFDQTILEKLHPKQILINASRGEVIDNKALLRLALMNKSPILVLDVWENEPNIDEKLLPFVEIATPHIAGYSLDGKVRGTEMLYNALCQLMNIPAILNINDFMSLAAITEIRIEQPLSREMVKKLVHLIYDVRRDDQLFRQAINESNGFDNMRKSYPERRELSTLKINFPKQIEQYFNLKNIGFTVNNTKG